MRPAGLSLVHLGSDGMAKSSRPSWRARDLLLDCQAPDGMAKNEPIQEGQPRQDAPPGCL